MRRVGLFMLVLLASLSAQAGTAEIEFKRFSTAYLRDYYAAHPVRATTLGIHDHDGNLPDLSRQAIKRRVATLQGYLARLERLARADDTKVATAARDAIKRIAGKIP